MKAWLWPACKAAAACDITGIELETTPAMTELTTTTRRLPAALAVENEGLLTRRFHPEPSHVYRSPFARDCARILHARAFRRLAGKAQVFSRVPGELPGDHPRSRLTHTLEVAQIARSTARALGLNESLTEALALAHDIGHPPFGHAGERALDERLRTHGLSFDHNLHALRIVTWFEERYAAFRGLNLTLGVREGIIKHSRDYAAESHPELSEYFLGQYPPLEAQLIDLADEIAYLTADLDDGLDSGILSLEAVREGVTLFRRYHDVALAAFPAAPPRLKIQEALRRMLNALATDLMEEIILHVRESGIQALEQVRNAPARLATLSSEMESERAEAKEFLYANFYNSPSMQLAHAHAEKVVTELFDFLMTEPALLPADHLEQIPHEGLARTVADYIAGMTDTFIEDAWRSVNHLHREG
ncbi:MAG TPA: dNTP triphosphohydrolase [Terracidiphilus sp.]|nr:dNTP triphosphohydrolase [Terracidiphilus sp.]